MKSRVVLFDLDGTLIDSGAMILASLRHATRTVLAREIPDEELLALVGGPGLQAEMRALDECRATELVRCYREHNEPLHRGLRPCDGVLNVLRTLKAQGRRLGVVSAKRRKTIELAFDVLPLRRYFDVVVSADDTERHKPDPEPLAFALAVVGSEPTEAAYVGDSPFDIRAAKAGGLFSVGVTWGGIHARERLAREEPDALVERPLELLDVL